MQKEWQTLANELKFNSNMEKEISKWQMLKGFVPYMNGEIDGYRVEITLNNPLNLFLTTKFVVNIHIKSQQIFFLIFHSPQPLTLHRLIWVGRD